ncbi:hypothetical protein BH747_08610 [Enterococcus villorum]|uniref:Uncharacterized protein n=1 Tax=Enterococcus villorum TaxID=112904 RepID=A0A1V8YBK6_9ENTE|nr:hypothetical protein [Enterococcus villorum]OQO69962.1 hypothetical protein BH747_08610 [Enterococcus villorum]OQO76414.1 hypothetical protein BH744_03120 [Enterococcus villorum]
MNDEEKNKEQVASSLEDETSSTTDESSMEVEALYTRRTGVTGNPPLANQLKEINVLFQEIDDLKKRKQELNNKITKSYKEGTIYADETKESLRELFAVRRQMTIRKELQSIFGFDVIDFYKKVHNRDYSTENYIKMIEQIEKTMKKENPIETANISKTEFKITNKEKKQLKKLSKNWNELFITITHNDERKDTFNKIENLLTNAIKNGALNRFEKYNYYDAEQSKTLSKLDLNKWDMKNLLSQPSEVAELPLVTDTYSRVSEKVLKKNKHKINNDESQLKTQITLEEMTSKEKEQRPLEDTVSIASSNSSTIELSEDEPSNPRIPLDKQAKVIKELTYHQGGIDNLRKRKQELNKNVTEAYKKGDIYTDQTKADLRELLELRYQITLRKELQLIFGFDVIDFYRKATVQRKQLNGENYINMMEQIEKIVGKVQDNTIETINGKNSTFVLSKEEKTNFQNLIKGWDTKVTFMTRGDMIEDTAREIDKKIVEAVENGALDQFKKHHYYDVSQSKTLTKLGLNKWDIKELLSQSSEVAEISLPMDVYSRLPEKVLNKNKHVLNEMLTKEINQGKIDTEKFNGKLGELREINHQLNAREAIAKMTGIDIDKFGEKYISTLGIRPDDKTNLWRAEVSVIFKANEGGRTDSTLSKEEKQKIEEGKKNILSIYSKLKQFDKNKDWGNVRDYTQKLMAEIDHVVKANTKIIAKEYHSNDFKIDKGIQASIEDFSPRKEEQQQFKDTSSQEPKIENRESMAKSSLQEGKTNMRTFVGDDHRPNLHHSQNRKEELTIQIKKTFQEIIDLVETENVRKINVNEKSIEELYTDYLKARWGVNGILYEIDVLIKYSTDLIKGITKEADQLRETFKDDQKIYDGLTYVIDLYNENFTGERLQGQPYEKIEKNMQVFNEYVMDLARLENVPFSYLTQRVEQISDFNDQWRKIWDLDTELVKSFNEFNNISKIKETGKEPITTLQAEQIEAKKVNANFELKIKNAPEIPINPNKDQLQDGNEQLDSVHQTRKTTIEELKKKLSLNHSSSSTIQSNLNNKWQVKDRKNQLEQIM